MANSLPIASLTSTLTDWIGNHGVYAVFVIMAVDALLPVGGELTMLYAGALASGALAGQTAVLFGSPLSSGIESYIVLALAGAVGYLVGSMIGWLIGNRGGRPFIERHGRWLHLGPGRFARAERWFDSHESLAVFLGRLTPLVRSFISIPAGVFGTPIPRYVTLTFAASLIWCFGFAGAGWALGGSWDSFHHSFRYADYAAVLAVAAVVVGALVLHRRQARASAQ
ncbi:MAG: DedA family protein [Thermoleophilaceae bacterium]